MQVESALRQMVGIAAGQYRAAGHTAYYFARSKLQHDPAFEMLLAHGLIADGARVLDLGCGQGLLAAWLDAARQCHAAGDWPAAWPDPPRVAELRGIERNPREVARARSALGARMVIVSGDIAEVAFGVADQIVLIDVLHYLDGQAQSQVLRRARTALPDSGRLLLRVGDASAGAGYRCSQWVDRGVLALRGYPGARLHGHALPQWLALLAEAGFAARALPAARQASFDNVMIIATPR